MELIKKLHSKQTGKKRWRSFGLFLCSYCKQEVEKEIYSGKRDKSCGCNMVKARRQTCLKKYGVDNPTKNKEIRNKQKQTLFKNYGVIIPFKNKKILRKAKQTWIKNLGVDHPAKSKKIRKKIKQTKYINFYKKLLYSTRLKNKIIPLFSLGDYGGVRKNKKYSFRCVKCDVILNATLDEGKIPRCFKCYPIFETPNKQEIKLQNMLNCLFSNEYKFVGNGQLTIHEYKPDFVNNNQKKIIELYGDYWHKDTEKFDLKRQTFIESLGYEILVVWEKELKNKIKLKQKLIQFHIG